MPRSRLTAALLFVSLLSFTGARADISVLPHGPGAPALVSGHFPDRVHEFVWRNWNVIEPARIASVLGASEAEVTAIAVSMGLPAEATVPPAMIQRGYVTIIRRNWHLLPYEQLLQLLDMTPERLDVTLREEDFLWVKLGRTKPACEPLHYVPPNDAAQARAAEIRAVVEQDFGAAIRQPGEPRFDFVRRLSEPLPNFTRPVVAEGEMPFQRIVHSYVAVFGDPLLDPRLDPYPDGFLQRLSNAGINGVWLHAVLRDLAPGGISFPSLARTTRSVWPTSARWWSGRRNSVSAFTSTSTSRAVCRMPSLKDTPTWLACKAANSPRCAHRCRRCANGWGMPWLMSFAKCPASAASTPSPPRRT